MFKSINPATGELIREFPLIPVTELCSILDNMHEDQLQWRDWSFEQRAACIYKIAEILRLNSKQYANVITTEMGKPHKQALAEIEKSALACEYFAEHAESFLEDEKIQTESTQSLVSYRPLGVILAIMPWNFPFWQVIRAAVPALMAGNAVAFKHSPNVPQAALELEGLFHRSGIPVNIFRTLIVDEKTAAVALVHDKVRAVTLTGSTQAGQIVAAQAATQIKKCVLELGGSDPYLILKDADLDLAVETCAIGRMVNGGQSCVGPKRIIIHSDVYDKFQDKLLSYVKRYEMVDPSDENSQLGPLAREDLRDNLHRQVTESVNSGAELLQGGTVPDKVGWWYPVTVLAGVKKGMPAYDEELFGPVFSLIRVNSEEDAIAVANDSPYGLGAAVFSSDVDRAKRIARDRIEAGSCAVNDFVKSDPRLPFGGIKMSGWGRELALAGIREFVNVKTVVIR